MQLVSAILSNWKKIIKQNFNGTSFYSKLKSSYGQKATLKELYWMLIKTTELKPTSQKYFEKKFTDVS